MAPVNTLRSGALAHLAGVSPDTLRYYERKHLLSAPPRTQSGYRSYPPEALAQCKDLMRFRREFAAVLRQWDKLLAHHRNSPARLLESIADGPFRRRRFPPGYN